MNRAWALGAALGALALAPAEASGARLAALAARDLVLQPRATTVVRLGTVSFPPGARQGPSTWYVGRLRYRVRFAALPRGSRVFISAETARHTFSQVEFERVRVRGRPAVRWSTYELFSGALSKTVVRDSVEVSFRNYLQDRGVRGGSVPLSLRVEQYGGARVARRLAFLGGEIATTDRAPQSLEREPSRGRPPAFWGGLVLVAAGVLVIATTLGVGRHLR